MRKYCKENQFVIVMNSKIQWINKVLLSRKSKLQNKVLISKKMFFFSFRKLIFFQYFYIEKGNFFSRISYMHSIFLAQLFDYYCFWPELVPFKIYLHKLWKSLNIFRVIKVDFKLIFLINLIREGADAVVFGTCIYQRFAAFIRDFRGSLFAW